MLSAERSELYIYGVRYVVFGFVDLSVYHTRLLIGQEPGKLESGLA